MTDFLARVRVHWHAFAAVAATVLPVLLDKLQVIDLQPILSRYVGDDWAGLIIAILPLYIAFLRPMLHVEDKKTEEEEG